MLQTQMPRVDTVLLGDPGASRQWREVLFPCPWAGKGVLEVWVWD